MSEDYCEEIPYTVTVYVSTYENAVLFLSDFCGYVFVFLRTGMRGNSSGMSIMWFIS
jgi:hypothetical protein